MRVLAVEAEPGGSALLDGLLRRHFEVLICSSGEEAFELLDRQPNIAVILASQLDGAIAPLDFLTRCAAHFPRSRRVLISAMASPEELRRAINEAQVQHLASHPIDPATLLPAVETLAGDYLEEQEQRRLALSAAHHSGSRDGILANKDRLTGLYNHRSFQERFREEVSRARRYNQSISVLYADLDHFGTLNRGAGFRCGDEVLQKFASLLQTNEETGRQSDIASRFGGQQFVVLLPETDKQGAAIKAERLREEVSSALLPGGVSITVSIGVASFPMDGSDAADVLEQAELALRRAKSLGRDCVFLCGQDEDEARNLDVPNVHAEEFPTFHDRMGDLVYALERDRRMSCLYVDLSRLRRIEQEFGIAQHSQLLARAGQLLSEMRGTSLRRDDLLCRTDDADGYLCFLSPPRKDGSPPINLQILIDRITEVMETGLTEVMRGLTRDRPQVAVGMGRVLNNPMIRGERLVHRLVEETKQSAQLEWHRLSKIHKVELQDLIISGRLRTAFQPLVDLDTGDRFAFEALTRGPTGSMLSMPTTLFSVADAVDLTLELDRACFGEALRNAKGCKPIHRLFLNLLPASFYDVHFIEHQVVALLNDAGLTPANLVFEITERLAIENFAAFRQALRRYTDMGFGVAVDDVGTRHSNLEAVMALQPHFIKLSEILCRGVTNSTVKREMVRSLVRIAAAIDAVTVAEGIEDLEDLMTLRDLGVRFGQGYFLARPDFCFPNVQDEAHAAILARPQRGRPTGTSTEQLISALEVNDEDATGPILSPPQSAGASAASTSVPGSPPRARAEDGFEDEPTRTRGDIN